MKGTYEKVLKNLRDLLADNAIYTLQFDLPLDMVRGFSLTQRPYIIVINKNDSTTGKIFTLLHEYAHILLRLNEGIICSNMELLSNSNDSYTVRTNNIKDIEIWCNRFAVAFLLPYKHMHNELLRYRKEPSL